MAGTAARRATCQDLAALPPHLTGQLVDGVVYATPRPAGDQALTGSVLAVEIGGPFMSGRGGPGGWWIVYEPELHFGDDVLVPDLAGWRRERLPAYPAHPFLTLPPDWACEILSPSTAALDRARKMAVYARVGVRHAWLVDPKARTLEVYALEAGRWVSLAVHAEDATVRAEPFAALALALDRLWTGPPAG
jgi:Uma2 family endonuclease